MHRATALFYLILLISAHPTWAQTYDKQASYAVAVTHASKATPFSITGNEIVLERVPTDITQLLNAVSNKQRTSNVLGFTKELRPVRAYYFPGLSTRTAMVIGGVHGSELASIEVATSLIKQLGKGDTPFYNVLIVPALFPDNAARAAQEAHAIGTSTNVGRYTHDDAADPNRQMPTLGKAYEPQTNRDARGRPIEHENSLLLQLIQAYKPERIVNIHAIRDTARSGIYADPRTDAKGFALGFDTDSSLAVAMARAVVEQGGIAPGNRLDSAPSALYYKDPPAVAPGKWQRRNNHGSALSNNRGHGVSLGSWASTAVEDASSPANNRPAIRLLTIEFPGYRRPQDYPKGQQPHYEKQVALYAAAIKDVFLAKLLVEGEDHFSERSGNGVVVF
jgi:hypothetical protein